jgi:hypothetical protein
VNAEYSVAWCEHGSAAAVKAYKLLQCEYNQHTKPFCHNASPSATSTS